MVNNQPERKKISIFYLFVIRSFAFYFTETSVIQKRDNLEFPTGSPGYIILQYYLLIDLSSPRAESARAVTGRRNSYRWEGEDFLSRQPDFFTETAVTPEQKVEKSFPRWEINRHVEG